MLIKSTILKNAFYLLLVQGGGYILPLITFPYLVRTLGPTTFGILGFSQAAIQYVILVTEYGFNWTATQQIARKSEDKIYVTNIFWSVIFAKLILFVLSSIIVVLVFICVQSLQQYLLVVLAFVPMVLGNVLYPVWFFQGIEKMKMITICTLSSRFFIIPLTFILVQSPDDVWVAAIIQSCVFILSAILSLILIHRMKYVGRIQFNMSDIKERLFDSWHVFISNSAINLYTTSTVVILGIVGNATAVGYFNAANTIRISAQGLLNPIIQAVYPRVSSLIDKDYESAVKVIKKTTFIVGSIALLGSLALYTLSPWIIRYFVGANFVESISVLKWLSFMPLIIILSNIFGIHIMLTHGFKKEFSKILIVGGMINLIAIFPLIYLYQEDGAAISMLVTELVITILMFKFVKSKKVIF
ncbi:flippase [Citrobacter freundii]|nr:flippase [Citrobacter freundii]